MRNNNVNKLKVIQLYKKFQEQYGFKLPKLHDMKFVQTDYYWAQFKSQDLYNKVYVLFLNNDLFNKNSNFIREILFHEFTHIYDSIAISEYPNDKYKNIMNSYSEFHASKVAMMECIKTSTDNPITLNSNIVHGGIISIEKFMSQTMNFIKDDFRKMANNKDDNNLFYDLNQLYYFLGYISALKEYDINYNFNVLDITFDFSIEVEEVRNSLLCRNISFDIVNNTYTKLEDSIKMKYIMNNMLNK